ncbi:MAG: hypothetical protein JO020_30850 [Chloroflexi bacterium]|nr:hypothetical protein [Chloroflexota bacterium]MBV9134062.1 hypothetical protein [Chloroflexota bacterium]MBV9898575.1 hypothetical protein [Chloroflexota bacterium]
MVESALVLPRSTLGQLLGVLLAALLLLSTPVGAGQGIHSSVLLHPILPHVHLLDGRVMTDAQLAAALSARAGDQLQTPPPGTTALGAGSGADTADLGLAIGPTPPGASLTAVDLSQRGRVAFGDLALAAQFRDAPQDPPPDTPFA